MHTGIWVTSKNQVLDISQMDTSHIINCVRLIQRRKGWRRSQLDRLLLELEIRSMEKQ